MTPSSSSSCYTTNPSIPPSEPPTPTPNNNEHKLNLNHSTIANLTKQDVDIRFQHQVIHLRRLLHCMTPPTPNSPSSVVTNHSKQHNNNNNNNNDLPVFHIQIRASTLKQNLGDIQDLMSLRHQHRQMEMQWIQEEQQAPEMELSDHYSDILRGLQEEEAEEEDLLRELVRLVDGACLLSYNLEKVKKRKREDTDLIQELFFAEELRNDNDDDDGDDDKEEEEDRDMEEEEGNEWIKAMNASRQAQPQHEAQERHVVNKEVMEEVNDEDEIPKHPRHNTPAESVEELQKSQAEALEEEISEMAAQLKASTRNMNVTLKQQNQELYEMEDMATQNLDQVTNVTDHVTEHVKSSWNKKWATWSLLFGNMLVFFCVFLVIRTVPKRKNHCLFWCSSSNTKSHQYSHYQKREEEERSWDDYRCDERTGECYYESPDGTRYASEPSSEPPSSKQQQRQRQHTARKGPKQQVHGGTHPNYHNTNDDLTVARVRAEEIRQKRIVEKIREAERNAVMEDQRRIRREKEERANVERDRRMEKERQKAEVKQKKEQERVERERIREQNRWKRQQQQEEEEEEERKRNQEVRDEEECVHGRQDGACINPNQIREKEENDARVEQARNDAAAEREERMAMQEQAGRMAREAEAAADREAHRLAQEQKKREQEEANIKAQIEAQKQQQEEEEHTRRMAREAEAAAEREAQHLAQEQMKREQEEAKIKARFALLKQQQEAEKRAHMERQTNDTPQHELTSEQITRLETELAQHSNSGSIREVQHIIQILTQNKHISSIRAKDSNGWEAIHEAARGGHVQIVEMLLEAGADVNAKTGGGHTPLFWALKENGENHLCVRLLRERGGVL
eukprot:CAMPEP_0195507872 /NCGR_PEP_ID=MMETSP0794_2-20130614/1232_1 /TAXON_ID=515487 /ORGANISM="Stephanopyxis turris, Strain CCMP 815" /LENGTH=851 /DNA_ID=CAMNT_0040634697 /DNA_START=75 /DNA_END=2630 /DNA_ORIENTATION=+